MQIHVTTLRVLMLSYLVNVSVVYKHGRAAGLDGIEVEHIAVAHPIVQSLLIILFNSILHHG